jgi:hypothetical protein
VGTRKGIGTQKIVLKRISKLYLDKEFAQYLHNQVVKLVKVYINICVVQTEIQQMERINLL